MIELIPAIDLLDGKVVRLLEGDYKHSTVYGTPLEVAKYWQAEGAKRLHVVDLDGAKSGKLVNTKGLEEILSTGIQVQFGGGIRSWETLEYLFELGVRLAILGTAAIKEPNLMIRALKYYKGRIISALDTREGKISVEGWQEDSTVTIEELLTQLEQLGLKKFIYTDILRDGTLKGPDVSGVVNLCSKFPQIQCILSGGISSLKDLDSIKEQTKQVSNLEGIISGKALYEKRFSLRDAQAILQGVKV